MVPQYVIDYILKTKLITRHHTQVTEKAVYVLVSLEQNISYLYNAIANGAKYAIVSREIYLKIVQKGYNCEVIPVDNPAKFWAYAASLLYPQIPKIITTLTGTSGKTSVAYMYIQAVSLITCEKALYIGTLGAIEIGEKDTKITDTLTTPDAMDLRKILSQVECKYACIESSSHGIEQSRIDYIPFKVAAFTNLSPEHLDYYKDIESYFDAKKRLFTDHNIDNLVLNYDDQYSQKLIEICQEKNIITYGKNGNLQVIDHIPGHNFSLKINDIIQIINWQIPGIHNLYNIICVIGMLMQTGFKINEILPIIDRISLPQGRMEKIMKDNLEIFIDYAHKPNALEAVLQSLMQYRNATKKGQLWIVFGCGGNRDAEKRSIMGGIAGRLADKIIVTDDNPRYEDPQSIRDAIISGIKSDYIEIGDRQSAIEFTIKNSDKNDIILIAGKGHENYQIIGDKKIDFSDLEVVKNINKD